MIVAYLRPRRQPAEEPIAIDVDLGEGVGLALGLSNLDDRIVAVARAGCEPAYIAKRGELFAVCDGEPVSVQDWATEIARWN